MTLHDWTDERGWDSVHPLWLTYLPPRPRGFSFSDAITRSLGLDLPPPFAAAYRIGEVVPVGDDVGSLVGLCRRRSFR